jgi:Pvc16 N-terminal domain
VIDDLDSTLAALLQQELPSEILAQAAITFATPDERFPPQSVTLPAIDLFLYDVRENRDLRANEWLLDRAGDGSLRREPPPVRVDCSYLVTAWPSSSSTSPALDEHHLLGAVITALLRHPKLPPAILQGTLAAAGIETPTTTLQQDRLQGIAEFWQALGGRPRAAFDYTVTIALRPFEPVPAGPPVTEKRILVNVGTTLPDESGGG